jgi:hypothetical protein
MLKYHFSNGDVPTRLIFITACVCAQSLLQEEEMSAQAAASESYEETNPQESGRVTELHTGGGPHMAGSVNIGRDQVQPISVGNISNSDGIVIGHGAQAHITQSAGATPDEISRAFAEILRAVHAIPKQKDREEAVEFTEKLEAEARLGEQAEEHKVQRWLKFLAEISQDAWEVAVDTFIHPIKGVSTVFQKVAQRAREEKKNG